MKKPLFTARVRNSFPSVALVSLLFLLTSSSLIQAQTTDEAAIKKAIYSFAEAADKSDAQALEACLDDNFRVVMNRLFGSTEVSVMPKSVYLEKIKAKEFGGEDRQIKILQIIQSGNTATAKVTFIGSKITFVSLLGLIKDSEDQWKLISDSPVIQ